MIKGTFSCHLATSGKHTIENLRKAVMERSKSLVLKEFWGGELEFYIAIYRASQIKG